MMRKAKNPRPASAFSEFFRTEAAAGVVLLACALVAIAWANSAWRGSYTDLLTFRLTFGLGQFALEKSIASWVKDGLMVVFFLLVGLEIKRELLLGELASRRKAALPVAAALGGAVVPALVFVFLNFGTEGSRGWGIPMATDIAFALGALALVGGPGAMPLRIFLVALAIVDDLIAVLVVAIFYSEGIEWVRIAVAATILLGLLLMQRRGVTSLWAYAVGGFALWLALIDSGVHTTIAGVLLAATIPARVAGAKNQPDLAQPVISPLERLEHLLHPWVAFGVMPVFALANAGVLIRGSAGDLLTDRITLGIIVGLVVGKQVGITLATWAALKLNLATLPNGLSLKHVYAVSWLAGIGFTMSIFVATLAFDDPDQIANAKIGILLASAIAGATGFVLVRRVSRAEPAFNP